MNRRKFISNFLTFITSSGLVFAGINRDVNTKGIDVMSGKNGKGESSGNCLFCYTIYGDCASKKNSKRIIYNRSTGKPMIISSKKYDKWEKDAIKQMENDKVPKLKLGEKMNAKIIIFRKNRLGGSGDLNNFLQGPLDLLVKAGVLKDDNRNIIYSTDGSRMFYDKDNPRVEIELTLSDEDDII